MRHVYAFEKPLEAPLHDIEWLKQQLEPFQQWLRSDFAVCDMPKGFIWTTWELATNFFRDEKPLAAYTSEDFIYLSPELDEWKGFYAKAFADSPEPIRTYFKTITLNEILTIAGHELVHHSDFFVDDFSGDYEHSIWFEEGMCDYIARKHLLGRAQFDERLAIDQAIVEHYTPQFGTQAIDDFGQATYARQNLTEIFYEYCRSFITVQQLVDVRYKGDITEVFRIYKDWHTNGRQTSLASCFTTEVKF